MQNALAIINAIPFLLAALMIFPVVRQTLKTTGMAFLTGGTMLALFLWFTTYIPEIDEGPVELIVEWVPALGLSLSWYLDPLSLLFGLVVTGVGIAVFFYSGFYLEDADDLGRFYMYLCAFAGAMLGLVLAGNIITLFIAWELTSIMSYLLIGFKGYKSREARTAASRALVITGAGGLALLGGLLLLGTATNNIIASGDADLTAPVVETAHDEAADAHGDEATENETDEAIVEVETDAETLTVSEVEVPVLGFQLSTVLNGNIREPLQDHPWYAAIVILIMIGCFTKSAQFPFHFWLPGAMTAPSPASAYLHSATMVKAGIYLLFRLYDPLANTDLWTVGLMGFGLTTMLLGAVFALRQRDLKGLLAYSTISKLGVIVALIGVPEAHGLKAAVISIVAHAMYKGTFFLLAGTIEHATGTRDLDELGGLARRMPAVFIIAALVGLSMAGVPPMVGFAAKEFLLDELLPYGEVGILPIIIAFTASVLTVVAALLYVWDTFISQRNAQDYHHFHAPSPLMNAGPALLAAGSLVFGLFIDPLLSPIVDPLLGGASLYIIPPELNPAENTAFALSLGVLALGPVIFALRGYWLRMPWIDIRSGAKNYASLIRGLERTGDFLLLSQNGKVRYYLIVILGVISGLMLFGGFGSLRALDISLNEAADVLNILLLLLTIGGTAAAIILRQHLLAALSMGVAGYAIGGIFLLEPAPDVALVQFLIETLATVLIILMITRIDKDQRQRAMDKLWHGNTGEGNHFGIVRDAAIAVLVGVSVALFALAAVEDRDTRMEALRETQGNTIVEAEVRDDTDLRSIVRPISLWHLENAYQEAGIPDVVAAIVTDFRGTDTLLEITVFATAAIGVLTLLTAPAGGELLTGKRVSQVMRAIKVDDDRDEEVITVPDQREDTPALPDEHGTYGSQLKLPQLSTPLTRSVTVIIFPFSLLISLAHIFYGGDNPGDGFTAGIVSGLAVALWYVVFGYVEARQRLRWLHAGRLIIAGLTLAFANAIFNLLVAGAFLQIIDLGDGPAGLHLASTLIFEIAIYLSVFGGVTMIMQSIAQPEKEE